MTGDHPLSEHRRGMLRESGIIPLSSDVQTLCVLLGAASGAALLPPRWNALLTSLTTLSITGQAAEPSRELVTRIIVLCGLIPFGACIGGIFGTLIQSRFLLKLTSGGERFGEPALQRMILGGLKILLFSAVAWIFYRKCREELALGEGADLAIVKQFGQSLFGLLLLFALAGKLVTQLVFSHRFRMSSDEAGAESREGEMRPELRAATERAYSQGEN